MFLEIYDLECLANLFTYTGYRPKTKEWFQFVICPWRNDGQALYEHLTNKDIYQVGFNNLAYDYPLEHHFIRHWEKEYECMDGQSVAQALYAKSQYLIDQIFTEIKKPLIPQIDLYKIWHYNNAARATSLKDLEIAMRMNNIEEMPFHHAHWCKEGEEKSILGYNKNDVDATFQFLLVTLGKTEYSLYKGKNKLELRSNINKKFGVNVTNMGDVPMGEDLVLNLYARATRQNPYFLSKSGGTHRSFIKLKDCVPKWCKLETKEFNKFLDVIKNTTVKGERDESGKKEKVFSYSVIFHGISFDFGLGGSHGCIKPGVYKSDDKNIILDLDVSSLYPSVARSLGIYPEHLGPKFIQLYSDFIDRRIKEKHKPKEEKDNVLIEGYKLVLNGVYGKSGEEKSFLYDPLYKYKTTISGQLFIAMWAERMVKAVPELKFIQINTDGITIMLPKDRLDKIKEVNEQLTKETTLVIEEAFYSKMVITDVNNYLAVYTDSTKEKEHIKFKGAYEIDKEYHKDPSMRIVPLALKNYFVYDIPIEDTIKNDRDIFNFCLRLKTNSKSIPYFRYLDNGNIKNQKLDRTTRYYISNKGGILYKDFDGKLNGVNVGYSVTLFNRYEEKDWDDYDINYRFYINEVNKIKNPIIMQQLDLFDF